MKVLKTFVFVLHCQRRSGWAHWLLHTYVHNSVVLCAFEVQIFIFVQFCISYFLSQFFEAWAWRLHWVHWPCAYIHIFVLLHFGIVYFCSSVLTYFCIYVYMYLCTSVLCTSAFLHLGISVFLYSCSSVFLCFCIAVIMYKMSKLCGLSWAWRLGWVHRPCAVQPVRAGNHYFCILISVFSVFLYFPTSISPNHLSNNMVKF